MIFQACFNEARPADYHPALPLTADASARDVAACVAAGAGELHLHPHGPDGRESLAPDAVGAAVMAVRRACPGTLVGVSTGAWIEGDPGRTLASIEAWRDLPNHASVNLSEPGAPEAMECLRRRGVGIEAVLDRAGPRRPVLLHGLDATVWRFVGRAAGRRVSTRVGLEDGRMLPDGTVAPDNAALVAAAAGVFAALRRR